jgi:hypothetical protein
MLGKVGKRAIGGAALVVGVGGFTAASWLSGIPPAPKSLTISAQTNVDRETKQVANAETKLEPRLSDLEFLNDKNPHRKPIPITVSISTTTLRLPPEVSIPKDMVLRDCHVFYAVVSREPVLFPVFSQTHVFVRLASGEQIPLFLKGGAVNAAALSTAGGCLETTLFDLLRGPQKEALENMLAKKLPLNSGTPTDPEGSETLDVRLIVRDRKNGGRPRTIGTTTLTRAQGGLTHHLSFPLAEQDLELLRRSVRDDLVIEPTFRFAAILQKSDLMVTASVASAASTRFATDVLATQDNQGSPAFVCGIKSGDLAGNTTLTDLMNSAVKIEVMAREQTGILLDGSFVERVVAHVVQPLKEELANLQDHNSERVRFILNNGYRFDLPVGEIAKLDEVLKTDFERRSHDALLKAEKNGHSVGLDTSGSVGYMGVSLGGSLAGNYAEMNEKQQQEIRERFRKDLQEIAHAAAGRNPSLVGIRARGLQKLASGDNFGWVIAMGTFSDGCRALPIPLALEELGVAETVNDQLAETQRQMEKVKQELAAEKARADQQEQEKKRLAEIEWARTAHPGKYYLQVKFTGQELHCNGYGDNSDIVQGPHDDLQRWELIASDKYPGYFYVQNVQTRLYLDVFHRNGDSGGRICGAAVPDPEQVWKFTLAEDGYFYVQPRLTGFYLDVRDGLTHPGARICQASRPDPGRQVWKLTPAK